MKTPNYLTISEDLKETITTVVEDGIEKKQVTYSFDDNSIPGKFATREQFCQITGISYSEFDSLVETDRITPILYKDKFIFHFFKCIRNSQGLLEGEDLPAWIKASADLEYIKRN